MRRKYEKTLAGISLVSAVAIAFTSLLIREDHDVTASIGFVIAQFLTLTATLLGFDYKFSHDRENCTGGAKQQPLES